MKIFHNFNDVGSIRNAVVTTGSFDGVHIGHKMILQRLRKLAMEIDGETVLITFHPHPRKVLYPESVGRDLFLINSQREKIELLRKAGLDNLIIVEFTVEFSKITSLEFVTNILLNKLHSRIIVIGFNHHFGHNREGDYEALKRLGSVNGFGVEEIPEQDIQNESVSSTKIRKALQDGNIQKANAYLDHQYIIMGEARKSSQALEDIGFPCYSLRIEEDCKLVPPNGVYAVTVVGEDCFSRAMCFIRKNEASPLDTLVEVHLLESYGSLEGAVVTILFHKRIREERVITTTEDLRKQLILDRNQVDELIF
ncbi:MAG: riboflavin kinase [Bacteroidales bacterium]|nr:riboflavin kinase [Bacteroidales bacterium]NCA76123.1 riboflavin biosynthesis protein RibF [Alphaproteobacteria bacterium]HNW72805.1 riboflavin kinase [Bacteroidales bacterium]HPS50695.1 riboflavin kinase [Bacteroidales bacterium]